ncbi:5-oxoprolinase subunit PxpA [Shewanella surugensis]|uniref:5-oxoprolinase subunit PxpA n=1 Tax=Shewanella surugensis TaxID=212020 RepID=A0ABT0LIH2_9GAMM|nr:5-oxoprolinase subunit PxpA [Shewanella surugensis]MCL1127107.1 5-oxoprolinase subunit PxpA [Shewanella surugensis]
MKLNCDMGESYGVWTMGNDNALMPWINMANIACGFHASDPDIMANTITQAKEHHVFIGAHISYHDKQGFGRRSIPHTLTEIAHLVAYQCGALLSLCQLQQTNMTYVKPHGALHLDMMTKVEVYEAIIQTLSKINLALKHPLKLVIQSTLDNIPYEAIAQYHKVELILEAFADRAYGNQGLLMPRSHPQAILNNLEHIKQQSLNLTQGFVKTYEGRIIDIHADTLCIHSDNPISVAGIADIHRILNP